MINEIKVQARQDIENVVAGYRNDETRTNYHWKVKAEYQTNSSWFIVTLFIAMLFYIAGKSEFLSLPRYISWIGFAPLIIWFVYYFVTENKKFFQEKSWVNDGVSDEDILRLCENPDLKPLIKDDIARGDLLTYTSLLERLPNYLSQIEAYHGKMQRDALIRKIDQNG